AVQAGRRLGHRQQPHRPPHASLGTVHPQRGSAGRAARRQGPARAMRNTHVPPGFWRGVNINQNAIFLECFMDELAHAAGEDALEFRRKLMTKHPKHLAVLNAVADRAGWGKPAPRGVYRGLAHMMSFASYVAACAEISVSDGNKVKIRRIVGATDCGYAVNP